MSDGMRDAERPFGAQKGANLSSSPPLDLRAVEARLLTVNEDGRKVTLADVEALLAHCRALRVELRKPWTYLASHGWNMKDIAAVLAQAVDHV